MLRKFTALSALIAVACLFASVAFAKGATVDRTCLTYEAWGLLDRIEQRFGPVQVISTCRPGARVAGTNRISRHASGNAIDFRAGRRKAAIVDWLVATHHSGGTMTYSDKDHIHVDIGPHFVALAAPSNGRGRSTRLAARTPSRSEASGDDDLKPLTGAKRNGRKRLTRSSGAWVAAAFGR
jgi:hypothetical protein